MFLNERLLIQPTRAHGLTKYERKSKIWATKNQTNKTQKHNKKNEPMV